MENKLVPKIRFSGYTDAWEQRKLKEVSDKIVERNKKNLFSETLTNSAEYGIVTQRDFFDKDISNEMNLDGYYVVREDDFVYNPRISNFAPVGPIKRNKLGRTGIMSPLYYVFRTHDIDNSYLEYFFDSKGWHNFMKLNGDSGARADRFAIKDSVFREMPIPFPNLDEQMKIGKFFDELSNFITLHQRKLDMLKKMKRSYLQQMFPKNDESVPRLRFANFDGEWEQRKLGELGTTYTGLSSKTKEDFGHGEGRFVTYVNVFQNPIASSKQLDSIELDDKQNKVQYGDAFFTTSSETPEEVGMSSVWIYDIDNVYLNSFTFGYRPIEKFDLNYLAFMLRAKSVRSKIQFLAQGISRYNISKKEMMNIYVPVTNYEEQMKIGKFFNWLEETINIHQSKLDKLKSLKKIYLHKILI